MSSNSSLINEIQQKLPSELFDGEDGARRFEARLIAEKLTGLNYSQLVSQDIKLDDSQLPELKKIVELRSTGMPLAYVLNTAYFRDLELFVDERVLIPRSETELLVEQVLSKISKLDKPKILEIGVGSGAISLSIVVESPDVIVVGTDLSQDAIDVANVNKTALGLGSNSVRFLQGSIFGPLDSSLENSFDVIVSNPPYIGEDEQSSLSKQVLNFEPHMALFADEGGFDIYRKILEGARKWLKNSGIILFEISPRHIEDITFMAKELEFLKVNFFDDFTGTTRIAYIGF